MTVAHVVVQPNDGWASVARRAGVNYRELATANGETVAAILHPGRILAYEVPAPIVPEPEPPPVVGRGDVYGRVTAFGAPLPGLQVPKPWWTSNPPRSAGGLASWARGEIMHAREQAERFPSVAGPVVICTMPLSFTAGTSKGANAVPSLLDMHRVGVGHYDDQFDAMLAVIAANPDVRWIVRLGHEPDIAGYPWSYLTDPSMIGDLRLAGSALLDDARRTGERAPIYVAAFERWARKLKAAGVTVNFNLTHPGAAINLDGGNSKWLLEGEPDPATYDQVGVDQYLRAENRTRTNLLANLAAFEAFAVRVGKPMSFPELGAGFQRAGQLTSSSAISDAAAAELFQLIFDWSAERDVAFLTYWQASVLSDGGRQTFIPDPKLHPKTWAWLKSRPWPSLSSTPF